MGLEHVSIAAAVRVMANFYKNWGKSEKAEVLSTRSLAISEKILGSESPHLVDHLEEHSALLRSIKRDDAANEVEKRIRIIKGKYGADR